MTKLKHKALLIYSLLLLLMGTLVPVSVAFAANTCGDGTNGKAVVTAIDIGCQGKGNPIADMTFGIIRFLSAGVGIVMVGSIVVAGIQYTTSDGNPQATAKAIERIRSTVIALLIFIFGYALLNYLIPGGFLN